MMAAKFVVLALLFVACSHASPLRTAVYSPLLVPVFVRDLDEPRGRPGEEYVLGDAGVAEPDDPVDSVGIGKRSVEKTDDDDDLETAAGTNVLRPLFVYRQQVAYRQRVRNAIRRGRRI